MGSETPAVNDCEVPDTGGDVVLTSVEVAALNVAELEYHSFMLATSVALL